MTEEKKSLLKQDYEQLAPLHYCNSCQTRTIHHWKDDGDRTAFFCKTCDVEYSPEFNIEEVKASSPEIVTAFLR